ncbi:MAG: hypothetical protein AAF965_01215 [Pseudomonadota bacterium]|mgnify:CR=1 FL=1
MRLLSLVTVLVSFMAAPVVAQIAPRQSDTQATALSSQPQIVQISDRTTGEFIGEVIDLFIGDQRNDRNERDDDDDEDDREYERDDDDEDDD